MFAELDGSKTALVQPFIDNGALDACRDCSGAKCCGNIKHGGTIEPPFLTSFDVARIGLFTGLHPDVYSEILVNPHTGNPVRFLKTTSREGCHFLNEGRCSIHDHRPIDCRLFPLDIRKVEGKLSWVIYNYNHCELTERDMAILAKQMGAALAALGSELEDYATVPVPGMKNLPFKIVGRVLEKPVIV